MGSTPPAPQPGEVGTSLPEITLPPHACRAQIIDRSQDKKEAGSMRRQGEDPLQLVEIGPRCAGCAAPLPLAAC